MITFNNIRWKNFLSTGNAFTELKLDRSATTLIVGENGSGKSTMLDAICFALFGKPYRNINKPQLMNSINKKDMVVEVEFSISTKKYKIVRGIKPNIFEIYCDGEMINQDAASRDYQKYLEQSVLKLNYKSFTQIVILGTASFTPFMQLPLASRREIIEDILDIQIFTTMNNLLKEKQAINKVTIQQAESKLEMLKQKAMLQKDFIETLKTNKSKRSEEIKIKIADANLSIDALNQKISMFDTEKEVKNLEIDSLNDPLSKQIIFSDYRKKFNEQIKTLEKDLSFYHKNDECPTCRQGIAHDFKNGIITEKQSKITEVTTAIGKLNEEFDKLQTVITKYNQINVEISKIDKEISANNTEIISSQRLIQAWLLELNEIDTKTADLDAERNKLKQMAKEVLLEEEVRVKLTEDKHYYDVAGTLLKDNGIKTIIIRQYLPLINKLINKYLTAMDFFVQFTLDEQFNESIKSRFRDDFSYASFSEGEKQRIDLALLFSWRAIAKMKNSANTNLLILDEVFDSSLDNNGTEFVMKLLNTINDETNVFVISHKGDQLFDKFRSLIKFEKKKNYSVML
jgi:DNA repair exonuclease SbcCD ATPase subunit